jgi:hypothetical protein
MHGLSVKIYNSTCRRATSRGRKQEKQKQYDRQAHRRYAAGSTKIGSSSTLRADDMFDGLPLLFYAMAATWVSAVSFSPMNKSIDPREWACRDMVTRCLSYGRKALHNSRVAEVYLQERLAVRNATSSCQRTMPCMLAERPRGDADTDMPHA